MPTTDRNTPDHNGDSFTKEQKLFLQGYNCAQSVFAANAEKYGIEFDAALRLSEGLGGGVGRMREVCGAFSACAMLAGLKYGSSAPSKENKAEVYSRVQKMAEIFRTQNGSVICREILELQKGENSTPTPDPRTAEYYQTRPCLRVISTASTIASQL